MAGIAAAEAGVAQVIEAGIPRETERPLRVSPVSPRGCPRGAAAGACRQRQRRYGSEGCDQGMTSAVFKRNLRIGAALMSCPRPRRWEHVDCTEMMHQQFPPSALRHCHVRSMRCTCALACKCCYAPLPMLRMIQLLPGGNAQHLPRTAAVLPGLIRRRLADADLCASLCVRRGRSAAAADRRCVAR